MIRSFSRRIDLDIDEIELRTFPVSRRGYDRADVDAFLAAVAADFRNATARYRQAIQKAEDEARLVATNAAASSDQPTFENVGSQVALILTTATQAAENLKIEAEQECDAIRKVAEDEAAELKRVAVTYMTETKVIRARADQEADTLLATARSGADEILAEAQSEAAQIEEETKDRATRADRVARARVETLVAEGRREYEHLRSLSQQMIDRISSVEFLIQQARDGILGPSVATGERFGYTAKDAEIGRLLGNDDVRNG